MPIATFVGKFFISFRPPFLALFLAGLSLETIILPAQTDTNVASPIPDPTLLETPGASARALPVPESPRALPVESTPLVAPRALPVDLTPQPATNAPASGLPGTPAPVESAPAAPALDQAQGEGPAPLFAALLTLGALGGFLLYQCGLTRAKNCAHTSMLVLIGVSFALVGYWMGGFAVQTGGVGDAHAAVTHPFPLAEQGALDHELGFLAGGRYWGLMGSAGFFLATDDPTREGIAALFLAQAVLLALAVAASLGGALERGRLLAMAVIAFLTGAVIYPLVANWIWGGGWLAELGRDFGLGHGVVDLAGAGVVHLTAGTLALVIALGLGPRHGRFQRNLVTGIPGHHVPFTILGTLLLLVALAASTACGNGGAVAAESGSTFVSVLLGAMGGLVLTVILGGGKPQQATPVRLTRGLLGGAVSTCGGGAFFDPWAAFLVGACAGLLAEGVMRLLESRRVDDPAGAAAIHGAAGAWGLLAVGLFANGTGGRGMNGVETPVRGLFFGGSWHQLVAQAVGCVVGFSVVFVLGYLAWEVVQRILGNRVKLAEELQGLDWPQVGALGYQPDVESGDETS